MRSARASQRARRRAGVTLLEVMMATTVVLISMLSAASSQLASIGLMRTAHDNTTATAELTAAMEEITGEPFDTTMSKFPGAQPVPAYTDRALRDERIVPSYPNGTTDPLTLVVTLTWTDWAGRPARMSVATLKVR